MILLPSDNKNAVDHMGASDDSPFAREGPIFANQQPPSYTNEENVEHHTSAKVSEGTRVVQEGPSSPAHSYYAAVPTTSMPGPRDPGMPPPAFSRAPLAELPYAPFQPIFLVARANLDKGFPLLAPPSQAQPHPFVLHDVSEGDWLSFLEDTRAAANLTEKDLARSNLPIVSILPVVNLIVSYGVQKLMKSRKRSKVTATVDDWNHHFFEPRKMQVVLMKGQIKLSGLNEHPMGNLHTPLTANMPLNPRSGDGASETVDTNSSSSPGSSQSNSPPSLGKSDDIYRLFVVSIS